VARGVHDVCGAYLALVAGSVGVTNSDHAAVLGHHVPYIALLAYLDAAAPGVVQQDLVELHPLDLVRRRRLTGEPG